MSIFLIKPKLKPPVTKNVSVVGGSTHTHYADKSGYVEARLTCNSSGVASATLTLLTSNFSNFADSQEVAKVSGFYIDTSRQARFAFLNCPVPQGKYWRVVLYDSGVQGSSATCLFREI